MKSSLKNMLLALTSIAAVMGGILALMHLVTARPIAKAETNSRKEALAAVLPEFDSLSSAQSITLNGDGAPVDIYVASADGHVVGTAVRSWTDEGFSGEISVMVGFDQNGNIHGYKVLSHAETPGLGAKADAWFRDSTGHRSIIGSDQMLYLSKDKEGGIDGITAATITSRAFLDAINRARRAFNQSNDSKK